MFQWMEVLAQGPVAKAILALSIVAAGGLAFGSLGDRGIRLGAAGVLFAGIFFGQLGMHIDERILEFVRDFGLLLFVYTVGLQVGPGFFSSVKQRGLQLNALGAAIVLLGGLIVAGFRFLFHFSVPSSEGYSLARRPIRRVSQLPRLHSRTSSARIQLLVTCLAWLMPWLTRSVLSGSF